MRSPRTTRPAAVLYSSGQASPSLELGVRKRLEHRRPGAFTRSTSASPACSSIHLLPSPPHPRTVVALPTATRKKKKQGVHRLKPPPMPTSSSPIQPRVPLPRQPRHPPHRHSQPPPGLLGAPPAPAAAPRRPALRRVRLPQLPSSKLRRHRFSPSPP
ncbi:hypothetical protein BRADI_3g10482v3 [Brachypodium distachyon]|uniref:Uncharacterized protein n=1 Tax=Brachypodium distachyon TaxID=15368 RepID=A0A0Q3J8D9_BRADI|nr:hypothetical protein BRADI_3g10482v3 [Brachypodium distachyon]